jgi:hypothetical protein
MASYSRSPGSAAAAHLYGALAASDGLLPAELAAATNTSERYVREWLNAQAAGGYIDFEPQTGRYSLSPEQVLLLADESSPFFVVGGFEAAVAAVGVQPRLVNAFRTGEGIGWHEHGQELFGGVERFSRSGYAQNLVSEWIPALSGVEDRLLAGARVADIGCGHGAATILLARPIRGPHSSATTTRRHRFRLRAHGRTLPASPTACVLTWPRPPSIRAAGSTW